MRILKFLIQLTFLVSLQEQICRKYFLKGFDNFLIHVLGLLYQLLIILNEMIHK